MLAASRTAATGAHNAGGFFGHGKQETIMNVLERLTAGETLVFDGAMGTMLIANGLGAGDCPEEWNASHPEVISSNLINVKGGSIQPSLGHETWFTF